MRVEPEEGWVDLEARLVNVDTGHEVQTISVSPAGSQDRAIAFANLATGTYRVTVEGDGVNPVHDVFVVM